MVGILLLGRPKIVKIAKLVEDRHMQKVGDLGDLRVFRPKMRVPAGTVWRSLEIELKTRVPSGTAWRCLVFEPKTGVATGAAWAESPSCRNRMG